MSFDRPEAAQEHQYKTKPPVPEENLVEIYRSWRQSADSKHIPRDYLQGARWWLAHQEPRKQTEHAEAGYDKHGNQSWRDPYLDRVVATWRIFLVDLTEIQKAFVIEGIERRNTPYRGDAFEFYRVVVDEQSRLDQAIASGKKDEYIDNGFIAMQRSVKHMVARRASAHGDD